MSGYWGILVSDPGLQNQFTQGELRSLKSQFMSMKRERVRSSRLGTWLPRCRDEEVDFESFLKVYLKLQTLASSRIVGSSKNSSGFLKAATTTLLHTISESEKASYVAHINNYHAEDEFLKRYLPMDPSTNDLFKIAKDGVLLCKLINVAVPGTIDERAINTKNVLNPWERNENHTLCLNSAKAIGCTVVNIGTQDFIEGRRHLVLGLISQIIKIQLSANLDLKKTPQLLELANDGKLIFFFHGQVEELIEVFSIDLTNITASVYSTELCNRLRSFLSSWPPSSPQPHVNELLIATADFERDLELWNISSPQGGVDSRNLFHNYILVWIQDMQLSLLDLCKAENLHPRPGAYQRSTLKHSIPHTSTKKLRWIAPFLSR
ncbi:hypothetical protein K1719_039093 [Acacia pycnantha]|nr:hypothetical protein K1719_039093 [Acacia pycnantha]